MKNILGLTLAAFAPVEHPALVDFTRVRTRTVLVERVEVAPPRIVGVDARDRLEAAIDLSSTTVVEGKARRVPSILPGDVVNAFERREGLLQFVATRVAVNLYTGVVKITRASPWRLGFTVVDAEFRKPRHVQERTYLAAVPSSGHFEPGAQIEDAGHAVSPADVPIGSYAKIYGWKALDSTLVDLLRVEVVHPRG